MSSERELMSQMDYLCLELYVARENEYEFMQMHIKRKMAWVARELVQVRDVEAARRTRNRSPQAAELLTTGG
jgi:hypothetical protein